MPRPSHRSISVLRVIGGLDAEFGGPSESSMNACIAAERAGVRNTFVFPAARKGRRESAHRQLVEEGIPLKTFALFPSTARRSHRWGISPPLAAYLLRHLREHDILHVHGAWGFSQLSAVLAATSFARPCVMTPHETLTTFDIEGPGNRLRPRVKRVLKQLYVKRLSLIVFSSHLEARDSLTRADVVRTAVIPHPLGAALEVPATPALPHRGPLRVGFLGRLHPKKNLDILIRALHAASEDARLLIAGEGPVSYEAKLKGLAAELRVSERVEWLGFVEGDHRWDFVDSLDVLAMPSRYECFGMVAAEAMARGTATVVSQNSGVAEMVERRGCGLVAAPTVEAFAEALRLLDRERGWLAEFAARGGEATRSELSLEAHGERIRHEYERLLEEDAAVSGIPDKS